MKFANKERFYAIAIESSYYVKKGEIQIIPNEELEEVLKNGKFKFRYTQNMHWDEDELQCEVIKETTSYENISNRTKVIK